MGVPLTNWLYLIGDGKGKTARMVNGVAKMLGGDPKFIDTPDNYRALQVGLATDKKYRSPNRIGTVDFLFVGNGADIMRYYMYQGKGFNENLYIIALQKSEISGKFELEYTGKIDVPNAKDKFLTGVSAKAKQGGAFAYITANESVVYSINSTATNANTYQGYFDGMTFREKYHYIYGNPDGTGSDFDLSNDFNNVFPSVYGYNEGYAFDAIKNNSILAEYFSLSDIVAFRNESPNYYFYRPYATNVTTGGQLKWCRSSGPDPYHVDVYFYTSLGNRYDVIINHELNGSFVNPETLVIPALNIALAPNEKIFLITTRYESPGAFTAAIFTGTDITFEIDTINQPTTARGFRPIDIWKELVSKISGGKCTGRSAYFEAMETNGTTEEVSLFSGQSLRNLEKAVLSWSFEGGYNFFDTLRPMGLLCTDTEIWTEPFERMYGIGSGGFDFGEVSDASAEYAFDALANSVQLGYGSLKIQEITGVPEVNGTNIYSLPIDSLKQEYKRVTDVITAPSEIERTRSGPTKLNNSNSPADTSLFAVNFSRIKNADDNYILTRKNYTSTSGTIDNTGYNYEGITPGRLVRAHGVIINPILEQQGNVAVKFETSDRTGTLITVEPGLTIDERAPVPKGALRPGFYHAYDLVFTAPTPVGLAAQAAAWNSGISTAKHLGNTVKLLPIGEINSTPATSAPQQCRLRISSETPLSVVKNLSLQGIYSIDSLNNTIFYSILNPIHISKFGTSTKRFKGIYDGKFEKRKVNSITQPGAAYLQKWVRSVGIPFQFVTYGYGMLTIKLRDEFGTVVLNQINTISINAAVLSPYTMQENLFDVTGIAEGRYEFAVFDGATEMLVSEWIDLKDEQINCHQIIYANSKNKYNTYFSATFNPSFFIEMVINELEVEAEGSEYTDELHDVETLQAVTWDLHVAQFGLGSNIGGMYAGIPDWAKKKINAITVLNNWGTDGVHWTKAKVSDKLAAMFPGNLPLNCYTVNINPANADTGLVYTGTPEPEEHSFIATMDASAIGIVGGGIISTEVKQD